MRSSSHIFTQPSAGARLVPVTVESPSDPSLRIEMLLPTGFLRTDGRRPELCRLGLPLPLAVYETTDPAAQVVVTSTPLPFEVDLEDWCRFRCASAGWHVVTSRRRTQDGDDRRGCELIAMRAGGVLRRDTASLDRTRLVQTHIITDQLWWSRSRPVWEEVADSLRLATPSSRERIERWTSIALPDTSLGFELPASWTTRTFGSALDRAVVDAEPTAADAPVWIQIRGARCGSSATPLKRRRDAINAAVAQRGFVVRGQPEPDHPRAATLGEHHRWREGWVLDALGPGGVAYELRVWHVDLLGHELDAVLVAAWHHERRLDWMRGIRALEIAVSTAAERPVAR